ncbi:hypothetical protein AQJ27_18075 [Streptomyces olivochromogenes]|uniref:DUF4232 domain-containing protein n=1 Tax=Streptomyces olivochromogenes TaxID=1963 RepID=A0A250V6Y7_STROL|nr:DUF4232 domain-containing protein [Streptomyces olivochromogenes]KUN45965.1 hypothetical protein AQJ27_18075 [Streptomyces olivochromogenes]GAX49953.1 hypothetical protein SO3561_01443 [Streptomyces olivochromogenes]
MYGIGIRRVATAVVTASAATLLMTACQPGGSPAGAGSSPSGAPVKPAASTSTSSSASPSTPSTPSTPAASVTSGSPSHTATPSTGAKACGVSDLKASMYQAAVRPDGTGTGAAIVEFTNVSGKACTVQGYPTVAGAGNGSPEKNRPLKVTTTGGASAVKIAAGGKAWTKLTFVQVQGEADGYCKSGATPASYPTLVVGVPGAGAHQVALTDGVIAECDDKATVTALSAAKPS